MRRRPLLILLLVLLLTSTLTASLAPPREPAPVRDGARPAQVGEDRGPRALTIDLGQRAERPAERVPAGRHVVVEVTVGEPGEVALEGLGLVASATPAVPAVFDLLVEEPGRYWVTFRPVGGEAERRARLTVAG